MKILAILALAALACRSPCRPDERWIIADPDAVLTPAYRTEIDTALEVIRSQERVLHSEWCGTLTIRGDVFPCPDGKGWCAGWGEVHNIIVAYDPTKGLGPAIGTTALEWDTCNAALQAHTCESKSFLFFTNPTHGACDGYDRPSTDTCSRYATETVLNLLTKNSGLPLTATTTNGSVTP